MTSDDPKARLAALYTRVAPVYVEGGPPFFVYAGRRLVELAGLSAGEAVLDVATGRGAVLLPAAARVGPHGRAVGVDLAPGMVEQTAAEIARRGLRQAFVILMDGEDLAFAGAAFDRVLCGFAVFFFPRLEHVLAEMRRVLRPAGTIGFAFSRGVDPRWRWLNDRLGELGAFDGLPPGGGDRAIRAPGALVAALAQAGFAGAAERVEETNLYYRDPEAWWTSQWTHGSRRALEQLPPDVLQRFRAECLARVQAMATPAGVPERFPFVYVTAHTPA